MQMFRKFGDEVYLIYNPGTESVEVGENIKILDDFIGRELIVQVIEQNLVDLAGILEDIIRVESIGEVDVRDDANHFASLIFCQRISRIPVFEQALNDRVGRCYSSYVLPEHWTCDIQGKRNYPALLRGF